MNWKFWVIAFCSILLVILPILVESQTSNPRQGRPRTRPNRRGNPRGRGRRPGGPRRQGGPRRPGRGRGPLLPPSNSTECELIQVPMCRGMVGYEYTRLPNPFGHTTQLEVYRAMEYLWAFMDYGCSKDFRRNACGFYLPKCIPGERKLYLPCRRTCGSARRCQATMEKLQSSWPSQFQCWRLSAPSATNLCIEPSEDTSCTQSYVTCSTNNLTMCANLPFSRGSLPNMFLQCSESQIEEEMQQYQALVDSNCSPNLRFFICGIFMPYCIRVESGFAVPCREICEEVRQNCEPEYRRLTNGLPWPNKFQCHRYPASTDSARTCASPSDVTLRQPDIVQPSQSSPTETTPRTRSSLRRTSGRRTSGRRTGRRPTRRRPTRRRPTRRRPTNENTK